MHKNFPLKIACIGCGDRGQMYMSLAAQWNDRFELVGAADPVKERVERIKQFSKSNNFREFKDADELLSKPKFADILIISTQDVYHYEQCKKGIALGYNILLEKPIATNLHEILDLQKLAIQSDCRVMVCYVLRYAPFYQKIKNLIDDEYIGEIISLDVTSGVSPWRMAHSYVRGHWANTDKSTPTIVAKACHDTDIINWLIGKKCQQLSSFGSLKHFRPENAPVGANKICDKDCSISDSCIYNSIRYAKDMRFPWLAQIYDHADDASEKEILKWIHASPWGRCVYYCDNDALDHQIVAMEFEGGITCTFTMTAFESGRHIEIYGTKGVIKAGETYRKQFDSEIIFIPHRGEVETFSITGKGTPSQLRRERDERLMISLYDEMTKPLDIPLSTSISSSVQSHLIAFAAEESRLSKRTVNLKEFEKGHIQ